MVWIYIHCYLKESESVVQKFKEQTIFLAGKVFLQIPSQSIGIAVEKCVFGKGSHYNPMKSKKM